MNTLHRLAILVLLCFTFVRPACGAPGKKTVIDFDDLFHEAAASLTDEIPGLSFEGVHVFTPAVVRGSTLTLSAATSGESAASSFGALIGFAKPVTAVSARFSPSFLSVNGVSSFRDMHIVGYDALGNEVAAASGPVMFSAETHEQATAFSPALVELVSQVPMSVVTFDLDAVFNGGGSRFLFDDLTFRTAPKGHQK
jgi:hypothetical protein